MKTLFVIIIGICFGACYSPLFRYDYKQRLSFYEDSLVNHFPKKFKAGIFQFQKLESIPIEKNNFHYYGFFAAKTYKEKHYSALHSQIDSITKKVYGINDGNLLVFEYMAIVACEGSKYPIIEKPYMKELAKQNLSLRDRLPVPWFTNKDHYNGEDILDYYDPSFKLHVIDAQPGIYLPEEKLYDSSKCMPEKWRHGFSRGVALCDKTRQAIFWIIIW